jgi:hypothetical protein
MMAPNNNRVVSKGLFFIIILIAVILLHNVMAYAVPPPLSQEELYKRSDLIAEGRVIKVWLYNQCLAYLQSGGLGHKGLALAKGLPATDEGMFRVIRNFPYDPTKVAIDGIYVAEVMVAKVLKGKPQKIIFIPFVQFHFIPGKELAGPWAERGYRQGEHLKMYLRKNDPFFESTWWNGVELLSQ